MRNLLLLLLCMTISCNSEQKLSVSSNYDIKTDSKGNIVQLFVKNTENDSDYTIINFHDNGRVAAVTPYIGKNIFPSELIFFKEGGVFSLRQYSKIEDTTISNQIYAYDKLQNIDPNLSFFAITDKKENKHAIYWASGFDHKGQVCIVDSSNKYLYFCKQILNIHNNKPIFEYNIDSCKEVRLILSSTDSTQSSFGI